MASYPAVCSLGHPPVTVNTDAELQSHITSEHPDSDPSSVNNALAGAGSSGASGPPVPSLSDPLSKWGITITSLTSIRPETVCVPTAISITDFTQFLASYGKQVVPTVDPDVGAFLIEFFRYVLFTGATEDASSAGSFQLRDKSGGSAPEVSWSSFFNSCKDYFNSRGSLFTPRRLARTCDEAFWEMWNNNKIEALNDVRTRGTPISRRFRMQGGRAPKAYVLVPELFDSRLTAEELEVRRLHQSTITKIATNTTRPTFEGLDQEGSHLAYEAAKARTTRIIQNAGASADEAQRAYQSLHHATNASVPPNPPQSRYGGSRFTFGESDF
ncbi:hypothetical protein QKP88_gp3 [Entoleuca gammaflexivirus 1]|uniref:Uncharacterized protein n=1 Tax=Entoleuca gammaflexivirus 1 TaxID=2086641 RepID=A0AAD0ZXF9_9VIRU|nr:hypothetical protein QKP88_gp3 [Entoleuca gammaflexivirus 1]AZG06255.1 hypothetical protein [Entoleuca gammaflexivirus 1]